MSKRQKNSKALSHKAKGASKTGKHSKESVYKIKKGGVEDQEYYHGMLPAEDLPEVLSKPGDFLVRITDTEELKNMKMPGATRPHKLTVISVCLRMEQGANSTPTPVHGNYVVQKEGRRHFVDSDGFRSVVELIDVHVKKKAPLKTNEQCSVPLRPICRLPWEIKHENVSLVKELGEGHFGAVHKGRLETALKKLDVAVKVFKTGDKTDSTQVANVLKEARIMRNFDHPHVVRVYGVAIQRDPLMIVMELVQGGSLDAVLRKAYDNKKPVPDKIKVEQMLMAAGWGLEYLHYKKCIHMDIAARNCLYTNNGVLKISDFGLSALGHQYRLTDPARPMPWRYMAPEVFRTQVFDMSADVWSYGVLGFEVFGDCQQVPYAGFGRDEMMERFADLAHFQFDMPFGTPLGIAELFEQHIFVRDDLRFGMAAVCMALEEACGLKPIPENRRIRPGSGMTEGTEYQTEDRPTTTQERTQENKSSKRKARSRTKGKK